MTDERIFGPELCLERSAECRRLSKVVDRSEHQVALLNMAAEHRGTARRDGTHDAALDAPEMTGARLSKRFAMVAEDIRHLQSRSHGTRSAGWHNFQAEPIERARRVADCFGGDPGVARRAREAGVTEQDLDDAHVRPALQEMGRECMA